MEVLIVVIRVCCAFREAFIDKIRKEHPLLLLNSVLYSCITDSLRSPAMFCGYTSRNGVAVRLNGHKDRLVSIKLQRGGKRLIGSVYNSLFR